MSIFAKKRFPPSSPEKRANADRVFVRPYFSMALHVLILILCIVFSNLYEHMLWWVLLAGVCGAVMVQIGFVGHDVTHGHLSSHATYQLALSLICWNLLLGLSVQWWRDKHSTHHKHTHVLGIDPDLYPLFAFDAKRAANMTGLHRWIVRHQHWLFWITLAGARLYFQWLSVAYLLKRGGALRWAEWCLLIAHHLGFWYAVFTFLPQHGFTFIAVSYAVTGVYMGIVFATNHLGMPHATASNGDRIWQAAHTRNIRTGIFGNYFFGGLNLQIEHHLYPAQPRYRLYRLVDQTRARCEQAGVPYHEQRLLPALRDVYASLRTVAVAVKT